MSKDKQTVLAEERGMGPVIVAFLIGAVAGAGIYGVLLDKGIVGERVDDEDEINISASEEKKTDGKEVSKKSESKMPTTFIVGENDASLVIVDQIAGKQAVVSMVTLKNSGWVTVRELGADGSFGNILGARHFEAGQSIAQTIELLRAMEAGNNYAFVLHADDGNEAFDHTTEVPVKTAKGKFIFEPFTANGTAER